MAGEWFNAHEGDVWELHGPNDPWQRLPLYRRSNGVWRSLSKKRHTHVDGEFTRGKLIYREPLRLPTEPGTVIAIGEWWLVRLRSYEGAPPAWEMLPLPSKALSEQAKRNGAAEQCVFGDDWVRAEAEQEGSFRIIAAPSGVSE